jgi:large conductance mechanosensitive channel
MIKEFKEFIMRGNVVDLAVGIIIGAAFGSIVTSLVNDMVMPPLGLVLARIDFKDLKIVAREKTDAVKGDPSKNIPDKPETPEVAIKYGAFINTVINFVIVAFVMFLIVKGMNKIYKKVPPPANTRECPFCCSNIPIKAVKCPNCTSEVKPA